MLFALICQFLIQNLMLVAVEDEPQDVDEDSPARVGASVFVPSRIGAQALTCGLLSVTHAHRLLSM